MSDQLCLSNTPKPQFSSLVISDLILFISFILSHPLYFLYFIFFSPYLFKLLSFLSPLFITTSLLLIALLTVSPAGFLHGTSSSQYSTENYKVSFLLTTYHNIVERLRYDVAHENGEAHFHCIEELEVYKIVFDTTMLDLRGNQVDVFEFKGEENCLRDFEAPELNCLSHEDSSLEEKQIEIVHMESIWPTMEEKILEGFFKELGQFDNMITCTVEEKKVEELGVESNKVVEENKKGSLLRNGSEGTGNKISDPTNKTVNTGTHINSNSPTDNGRQCTLKVAGHSSRVGANSNGNDNVEKYDSKVESSRILNYNLGSYGSMRKDKEWKRTLACKLFEERHNNVDGGGEGMDLLWETYEMDSSKAKSKRNTKKNKKKGEIDRCEDDDEEQEEEQVDGQLCCLQALKFSSGKMNLGMGRPNLVKISKALKGIGWFHRVSSHGKKVHHGDRF